MAFLRVDEYILRHAKTSPDAKALIEGERVTTYEALAVRSRKLALALIASGIRPGDQTVYALSPCTAFFELFLALSMIGASGAGLPTRAQKATSDALIGALSPKAVFCDDALADFYRETVGDRIPVYAVSDLDALEENASSSYETQLDAYEKAVCADTPLILIFTSGSTGTPKCAVLTQGNLIASALSQDKHLLPGGVRPDDSFLHCFPLNHVSGAVESGLAPLFNGVSEILCPRFEPVTVLETISRYRATVLCGVPTMWGMLLEAQRAKRYDLSSIRMGVSGASALPETLAQAILSVCGDLSNPMGMTETSGFCSYFPDDATIEQRVHTCGKIFPELKAKILDGERECAAGEIGELALSGDAVIARYLHGPLPVTDGYYRTGDLGFFDEDGYLHLCGRRDDMFTVGGYNVYPQEIEDEILRYPGVALAAVLPIPHHSMGSVCRAYVQPMPGVTIDRDSLVAYLESRLIYYKVPKNIVMEENLPLSPLGKIRKNVLAEQIREEFRTGD